MADVISGPVRGLPGTRHPLPKGTTCDAHPHLAAVARIQGETDSFGCELVDMCKTCVDEHLQDVVTNPMEGVCELGHHHAAPLRHWRDPDEGLAGRLYQVCDDCLKKQHSRQLGEYDHIRDQLSTDVDAHSMDDDYLSPDDDYPDDL